MRVSFTGYYGMRNFGDDLFGMLGCAAARQYWGAEPLVVGPPITGVSARYTVPQWYPSTWYAASSPVGQASRMMSFGRGLFDSDLLVLGGGSLITSRIASRMSYRERAIQVRKRLALGALGVSIGPFDSSAAIAEATRFLKRFEYIAVRDRRSYELALGMGLDQKRVHRGPDLAGLLPLFGGTKPRSPAATDIPLRIGIAPCNYSARTDHDAPAKEAVLADLVRAVARVARRRLVTVEVFCLNAHPRHGDGRLMEQMREALVRERVTATTYRYGDHGPLECAQRIGSCDAVVSARLHGAIAAYAQGVPVTLIDYHPKCHDFADEIGLPDIRRITGTRHGTEAILASIEDMCAKGACVAVSPEAYAEQAVEMFRRSPWWREVCSNE